MNLTEAEAIETLRANYPDACYEQLREAVDVAIEALKAQDAAGDTISRKAAIDALRTCYDTETVTMDDGDEYINYGDAIGEIEQLPPAQPERTCVNCGRTANNGGWYADGGTRCPIEEHYALPKDGYCHLWEKRNITDDDYLERREE